MRSRRSGRLERCCRLIFRRLVVAPPRLRELEVLNGRVVTEEVEEGRVAPGEIVEHLQASFQLGASRGGRGGQGGVSLAQRRGPSGVAARAGIEALRLDKIEYPLDRSSL